MLGGGLSVGVVRSYCGIVKENFDSFQFLYPRCLWKLTPEKAAVVTWTDLKHGEVVMLDSET